MPASTYGVRSFVTALLLVLRLYARHQARIDPLLPAGAAAALGNLVGAATAIGLLNKPGPG